MIGISATHRGRTRAQAWARAWAGWVVASLAFASAPAWAQGEKGDEPVAEESTPAPGERGQDSAGLDLLDGDIVPMAEGQAGTDASPGKGTSPSGQAAAGPDQAVSADQQRAARAVFLEANQLARDRFFATAATKYRQAIALWGHPAFHYNLALAQLHLDQTIEAYQSLQRALAQGSEALGDKYEPARQQLAILESQLGRIDVRCDEPGARVMLDGKTLFTGPGQHQAVVLPGAHQIVATKRGLAPVVEQVVLAPGEGDRFDLAFQYPEVTVSVRRWAAWKSWSVVGAGAALALSAMYLDRRSSQAFDDYDQAFRDRFLDTCDPLEGCSAVEVSDQDEQRRQQAESEQRIAVGLYIAGGAVLAAGAVLAYLNRERLVSREVRPESAGSSAMVPMISADAVGVSAAFRF